MVSKYSQFSNRGLIPALIALGVGIALFVALQNLLVSFAVAAGLFLLLYAPIRTWIKKRIERA